MELLENFKATGVQLVIVIDEYGEVQGLVTLRDVMEAITGEFKPRNAEDSWAVQREDGSWLLDGLIPIPELKDRLRLTAVPEEDKGRYHTLSGMMMLLLGTMPQQATRRSGNNGRWKWLISTENASIRYWRNPLRSRSLPPKKPTNSASPTSGSNADVVRIRLVFRRPSARRQRFVPGARPSR